MCAGSTSRSWVEHLNMSVNPVWSTTEQGIISAQEFGYRCGGLFLTKYCSLKAAGGSGCCLVAVTFLRPVLLFVSSTHTPLRLEARLGTAAAHLIVFLWRKRRSSSREGICPSFLSRSWVCVCVCLKPALLENTAPGPAVCRAYDRLQWLRQCHLISCRSFLNLSN